MTTSSSNFVTDTHGLIWYLENDPRLGRNADAAFKMCDQGKAIIFIPSVCLVEIIYLQEKGRIPNHLKTQLDQALHSGITGLVVINLTREMAEAVARIPRTTVPDMPDRMIAATALHLNTPLITKDSHIQKSGVQIVW